VFFILKQVNGDVEFREDIKLLRGVDRIYELKLSAILLSIFRTIDPFIEFFLRNGLPYVFLLNLVKLYHALNLSIKPEYSAFFRR
jgi:hypothetical protein